LLARIPEISSLCFFVDPFGGPEAAARSRAGLRAAHLWVRGGGVLVMFPSGEVAHSRRPDGEYEESPWLPTVGRIVDATNATVVPAFIAGTNSRWFYRAGRVHPYLRTALLARELLNKRGQSVTVRIGRAMTAPEVRGGTANETTGEIRAAMERVRANRPARRVDTVALDVSRLPAESLLVESGPFQVFGARAEQLPAVLPEIGRLRELTYRAVGEGTGRQLDLDRFDREYLHLFAWDREARQIVGAYRIGMTDQIVARCGIDGLYTRTLFRYDERLLAKLSPALELGRSFVRAEYQKSFSALLLLWKGIGQLVLRHPQYRVLFGPVSISARYSDTSHQLLMGFLQQNHRRDDLAALVEAINPGCVNPAPLSAVPQGVDDVQALIARSEGDGKGVPVLLRQYLKLDAKLLGFNIDPDFNEALDALMMVDLADVQPAILQRYLGRQGAATFLARHRQSQAA
jgi:putative hemolysin